MVSKAKMKRVMPKVNVKATPIGKMGNEPLILPNHSGYQGAQALAKTPTKDFQIANKQYVDGEVHWDRTGTNVHLKTSTDNVGIGTDTPSNKLEIAGVDSNYLTGPHIRLTTDADVYPEMQLLGFTHDNIYLLFDAYLLNGTWKSSDAGSNFNINKSGDKLNFQYDSGVAQGSTVNWNDGITIDTTGKVGIGTTTPDVLLDLEGTGELIRIKDSSASGNPKLSFYQAGALRAFLEYQDTGDIFRIDCDAPMVLATNNTERIRIEAGGEVGIGTSTPNRALHINNTVAALKLTDPDDTGYFSELKHDFNVLEQRAGNEWRLFTGAAGGSERVRVTSAGNVGIGTTSPNAKLDVRGNMSQSELTQTFSGTKILTSGSATGFVDLAIATGELIGGNIIYTIKVDNGTDLQCHMGAVGFVGVNKAGTVTCASDETYSPSSEIEVKTSGTLTDVFDCVAGTGKMTVRCNATTNLGSTPVITIDYTITMHSLNTITAL